MLVLSRQHNETIMVSDEVEITIVDIRRDKVRLGINAPGHVRVHRKEVHETIQKENAAAAQLGVNDLDGARRGQTPHVDNHPRGSLTAD